MPALEMYRIIIDRVPVMADNDSANLGDDKCKPEPYDWR